MVESSIPPPPPPTPVNCDHVVRLLQVWVTNTHLPYKHSHLNYQPHTTVFDFFLLCLLGGSQLRTHISHINTAIWTISHIRLFLTSSCCVCWGGGGGGGEGRGALYYPHWEIFPIKKFRALFQKKAGCKWTTLTLPCYFISSSGRKSFCQGNISPWLCHFFMTFLHDCAWCAQACSTTAPPLQLHLMDSVHLWEVKTTPSIGTVFQDWLSWLWQVHDRGHMVLVCAQNSCCECNCTRCPVRCHRIEVSHTVVPVVLKFLMMTYYTSHPEP